MRSGRVFGGRRRLGQIEVTDEVIRDLGASVCGRSVGGDLESTVALEGIGDDDLATQRNRGGVRERALAGSRRSEQREDEGLRQERGPRSPAP